MIMKFIQRFLPGFDNIITLNLSENSEVVYGISKQPSPTCPMIDDIINSLCNDDYEKLASKLEEIRKHVISIRKWGQEWKDLAKSKL